MRFKHSRDVAILAGLVYFTQGALGIVAVTMPLFFTKPWLERGGHHHDFIHSCHPLGIENHLRPSFG